MKGFKMCEIKQMVPVNGIWYAMVSKSDDIKNLDFIPVVAWALMDDGILDGVITTVNGLETLLSVEDFYHTKDYRFEFFGYIAQNELAESIRTGDIPEKYTYLATNDFSSILR